MRIEAARFEIERPVLEFFNKRWCINRISRIGVATDQIRRIRRDPHPVPSPPKGLERCSTDFRCGQLKHFGPKNTPGSLSLVLPSLQIRQTLRSAPLTIDICHRRHRVPPPTSV